jgi:ketosteroid isomerase-like protein
MKVLASVLTAAVVLGCAPVLAETPPPLDGLQRPLADDLLDRLVGSWRVSGTIQGEPAEQSLEAAWVLNHQFLRLDYRGVGEPPAGEPRYEATVLVGYDNLSERYVAHWVDVFGGRWSTTLGFGSRREQSIAFRFEYPSGPFENTFTWNQATGRWRFLLTSRDQTGAWSTFAELEAAPAAAIDLTALEAQVRATEAAFAKTMADRDHSAFASFVAEDAVFVGRSVLRGRQAVADGWKQYFEHPEPPFAWAPEQVVVIASGNLALSSGPVFDGDARVGTFNSTWRREPDGSWKIVLDNGCPPCAGY